MKKFLHLVLTDTIDLPPELPAGTRWVTCEVSEAEWAHPADVMVERFSKPMTYRLHHMQEEARLDGRG